MAAFDRAKESNDKAAASVDGILTRHKRASAPERWYDGWYRPQRDPRRDERRGSFRAYRRW
jgi:hypothetical protein